VLNELESARLQSDSRYAEVFVRSRAERGYGPQRIAAELKSRGTADELTRQALTDAECAWVELARQADRKKFGAKPSRAFEVLAKRRRFLEYRGFASEHIKAALNTEQELD
jgi:regulatory protein